MTDESAAIKESNTSPSRRLRTLRSYVLRPGRMTAGQKKYYEALREKYVIPFQEAEAPNSSPPPEKASPSGSSRLLPFLPELRPSPRELHLEIGFGSGETLLEAAEARPENFYLGIEVYPPGIASLLKHLETKKIQNVRVIAHDAVAVFRRMIPPQSLNGIHAFFPDPWPKRKHHKRRLFQEPFLLRCRDSLKPGGLLRIVTDWPHYALSVETALRTIPGLEPAPESSRETRSVQTKFETRGEIAGRPGRELLYRHLPA